MKESYDQCRQHIKKRRYHFAGKGPIVVFEKTLESPLDSKEIKPVNLKGNQF